MNNNTALKNHNTNIALKNLIDIFIYYRDLDRETSIYDVVEAYTQEGICELSEEARDEINNALSTLIYTAVKARG